MLKGWKSIIVNNFIALYLINNVLLIPKYILTYQKTDLFDTRIIDKTMAKEIYLDLEGSNEAKTYKYLKLSSILVDTQLQYDTSINRYDDMITVSLEKKIGDCKQFAEFTYADFLYFTKITNNKSLRNNVRLVSGYIKNKSEESGHRWLEIKLRDKWYPFEPTSLKGIGHKFVKEVNDNRYTLIDSLLVINNSLDDYTPTCVLTVDEKDNTRYYPEIVHALTEPKGYVYDGLSDILHSLTHLYQSL